MACSEVNLNYPKEMGEKPSPITDFSVESLYGGAKVIYKIPNSKDILYVKAQYKLSSGILREARSSIYKNFLIVDGFEKAGEFEISLYAVAKGEIPSEPTIIRVNVLTPPYLMARESLELISTFGGVNVSFDNKAKSDISVTLLEKDSLDSWVEKYTYYSSSEKADFSVRGYDNVTKEFGVFVKDRFGNVSDTLKKECTPIYEELIKKNSWKKYELPGDETRPHKNYPKWSFEKMWDNSIDKDDMFHTDPMLDVWPSMFTIDLGKLVSFSRMKLFQRQSGVYLTNNIRKFEVYGSNSPSSNGVLDSSWTKLGSFEVVKPSGSGVITNEDKEAAKAGHDFEFSPLLPSFRYVRFKILETWGLVQSVCIAEISFWGKVVD